MSFQKQPFSFSSCTLFSHNYKLNSKSCKSIQHYLEDKSQKDGLQQHKSTIPFSVLNNCGILRPKLSKNTSHLCSSEGLDDKEEIETTNISKKDSQQVHQNSSKMMRLQKQVQEQKQIIRLQEQLINKLLQRLQQTPEMGVQRTQELSSHYEWKDGRDEQLKRLQDVRSLLQSSLQMV